MLPRLLCLGDPGRVPHLGHFRISSTGPHGGWGATGRVRDPGAPVPAYHLARAVEHELRQAWEALPQDADRFEGLRAAWTGLRRLLSGRPGLEADLEILLVGVDAGGSALAGSCLGAVWGDSGAGPQCLTSPGHPLLALAPWASTMPGVLQLEEGLSTVVAVPRAHASASPEDGDWAPRCREQP